MNIRQMTSQDIDFAAKLTAMENWASETREVFEAFLEYHPQGCFIAEVDNKRIGMIVAAPYQTTGFLSELIVHKESRATGAGPVLFQHAIDYLHGLGIRNIYLDGVEKAAPYYAHVGFRKICRSMRFIGPIRGRPHSHVRAMLPEDIESIIEIDNDIFGDDRGFFLRWRFSRYPQYCIVMEIDGCIQGYILGMGGRDIVCAGPWVVLSDVERPLDLLEALALHVDKSEIRIGVLENNTRAVDAIRSIPTLKSQSHPWRMVLGDSDRLGTSDSIWAIGSPAKG